jgi:hypothetical protein
MRFRRFVISEISSDQKSVIWWYISLENGASDVINLCSLNGYKVLKNCHRQKMATSHMVICISTTMCRGLFRKNKVLAYNIWYLIALSKYKMSQVSLFWVNDQGCTHNWMHYQIMSPYYLIEAISDAITNIITLFPLNWWGINM